MSVVVGTRSSSSTSRVTTHSLPSRSIPVIDSTGRPIRSWTCSTALSAISRVDGPELELREPEDDEPFFDWWDLDSAIFDLLHLGPQQLLLFELSLPGDGEALKQLVLHGLAFLRADVPVFGVDFQLHQLPLDVVLVVELAVRLLGDLLGDPGGAALGSQRQEGYLLEEAHQAAISSSTKLWGGSGPV